MSSAHNTRIVSDPQEALNLFIELNRVFGLRKDAGDFEETAARLRAGDVTLFVCEDKGYALYNRKPRYAWFLNQGIPEIQDLNVHPDHRQQGIATAIVAACEELGREEGGDLIGIGVGLAASYAAAQCLYIKLGYMPDGAGVVYDAEPVAFGVAKPNDDDLCLMMMKDL